MVSVVRVVTGEIGLSSRSRFVVLTTGLYSRHQKNPLLQNGTDRSFW